MSQVIVAVENPTLRDLISINLKSYMGASIIPRTSAEDVLGLLSLLPEVDLVISDGYSKERNERSGEIIESYIKDNHLETALILLGPSPGVSDEAIVIEPASNWEKTVDEATRIMGVTLTGIRKNMIQGYVGVEPSYFLPLKKSCCDVFIRIKKDAGQFQYVKRLHADDPFTRDVIEKYISQGLTQFYIPRDSEKEFYTYVSNTLVELIEQEDASFEKKMEDLALGQEIAIKELKRMGFTPSALQLTESVIKGMESSIGSSIETADLLRKITASNNGLIYKKSHLTLLVATQIYKNRNQDSVINLERMGYACFFNDSGLIDRPELSLIADRKAMDDLQENGDDWSLVFTHASSAAELLRKHPQAPLDADTVIRHHHGSLSGRGFETREMAKIHEDARVLIVAESFARKVIEYQRKRHLDRPPIEDVQTLWGQDPALAPIIDELRKALTKRAKKN